MTYPDTVDEAELLERVELTLMGAKLAPWSDPMNARAVTMAGLRGLVRLGVSRAEVVDLVREALE